MIELDDKKKRIALIATAVLVVIVLIGILFDSDPDKTTPKVDNSKTTSTTTTTLPPANSQACEFFTTEILASSGIITDKPAVSTENTKRCTYSDISGGINYLTLFLGKSVQCDVLKNEAKNPKNIVDISPGAFYFENIDPTIIVKMADRCFFVQGSKTLIDEVGLTNMAKSVFALFTAADATTTTTTLLVDPNVTTSTILLPGQNTVVLTTTAETTNAKK